MSDDRHARGLAALEQLLGADAAAPILAAADLSPDLVRFAIDFAFGEVLSRPGLDLKTQELCTVAALAALALPIFGPRVVEWWVAQGPDVIRLTSVIKIVVGAAVAYSANP